MRLLRDGIFHFATPLLTGLVGVLLVPIMLKGLGAEAYGFWVGAQALAALAGFLDLGFAWSVEREVAAASDRDNRQETAAFVRSAGNAYLLTGIAGAALMALLGIALGGQFHLTAEMRTIVGPVLALTGLGFLGGQVQTFAIAILSGLRRFEVTTLLSVAGAWLQAAGIILLVRSGFGLMAVVVWSTATAIVTGALGAIVAGWLKPCYRFRFCAIDWAALRLRAPFAFTSQLIDGAVSLFWDSGPVLIATVLGAPWVVPFHVGRKFPVALSSFTWRAAGVLFPAASEQSQRRDRTQVRNILQLGTRWIVLVSLPIGVSMEVFAPDLLTAWLGALPTDAVVILRLMTLVVVADSFGVGAMFVLWGSGDARSVLAVFGTAALLGLATSLGLIYRLGVVGVAWAWLLPSALSSAAFLHLASRRFQFGVSELARVTLRGLFLPLAACGTTGALFACYLTPRSWPTVILGLVASGFAYVVTLYFRGAREEERVIIRFTVRLLPRLVQFALRPSKAGFGGG